MQLGADIETQIPVAGPTPQRQEYDPLKGTFDTSFDPYQATGVTRIPVTMESGKSVLTNLLGHGLGWNPDDELDAYTASSRLRKFLDAQKGIRDSAAPEISPVTAVEIARKKLEEARSQLVGHSETGPPNPGAWQPPAGIDPSQQQGFFSRMFPQVPEQRTATYADSSPAQNWTAAGYALARLLRGDSIGQAATYAAAPLNLAQKELDKNRELAIQNAEIDAHKAQAEYGVAQADVNLKREVSRDTFEANRANLLRQYTQEASLLKDQFDEAQRIYRETTLANQKAWTAEDKQFFKTAFDSKADAKDRMNALDVLHDRGRIGDVEYTRYGAVAMVEGSDELARKALAAQRGADANLKTVRADLLPKEYQVKAGELARKVAEDADESKIARERLRIMDERNAITLNLGKMRDATTNRRIDLQAPLWDAQIAKYFADAEAKGDASLKGSIDIYDKRLKELHAESARLRDDLTTANKTIMSKDARRNPEIQAQMKAYAAQLNERIQNIEIKRGQIQGERDDLAEDFVKKKSLNLSVPYKWGGDDPKDGGMDCSGFTCYVMKQNGIDLPRTAVQQFKGGQAVDLKALEPGDLIFWDTGANYRSDNKVDGGHISHVGIYMGDGKMRHQSSSKGKTSTVSLDSYRKSAKLMGARRYSPKG